MEKTKKRSIIQDFTITMSFLKGHYLKYSVGIVGKTILESSAALLESYLLKVFLDIGKPESMLIIAKLFACIIFYTIVILFLMPLFTFFFNSCAKYGHGNVKKTVYEKITKLPVRYFEKNHSGKLVSIFLNDTWVLSVIFMRHFRRVAAAIITIIIYLIPMFVLDWRITAIMIAINLLSFFINTIFSRKLKTQTKKIQGIMEVVTEILTNAVSGMSVIRIYSMKTAIYKTFKEKNENVAALEISRGKTTSLLSALTYLMYILNVFTFLLLGTWMVEKGLTTFGAIISIMTLQTAVDANLSELTTYYPLFFNGFAATERIADFLSEKEETDVIPPESEKSEEDFNLQKKDFIKFENVSFSYDTENPVLKNLSFSISEGENVAITGESGGGKSSIIKLMLGFYPVSAGNIYIGGKSIKSMTYRQLRSLTSYVPQTPAIFSTSIIENIRYGKPDATDEEVIESAKKADAYDFIMKTENGFNTEIGENGMLLSGGQRQRIAIARAILKDAPILLLDEATSALDNISQNSILKVLKDYSKKRTVISVAHRKNTVENADRIIELKKI